MNFKDLLAQLEQLGISHTVYNLFYFVLIAIVILLVSWIARRSVKQKIADNRYRYRVRKIIGFTTWFLIALLAIGTFSGKAEYFTVTIGFISAGIAFALQELILSVAGWIVIFVSGIYKPGDRVELNQVKGDVIDIGVTKTTLMEIGNWVSSDNYSGRIVEISNSFIFKNSVFNYSRDFPFLWDEIKIPIRYGSDLTLAQKLIRETADELLLEYATFAKATWDEMVRKYMIENAVVEPLIFIKADDNWVTFTLRFVIDYKKRGATKSQLFLSILQKIDQTDGKVQLASATFELTQLPPLKVDLKTP